MKKTKKTLFIFLIIITSANFSFGQLPQQQQPTNQNPVSDEELVAFANSYIDAQEINNKAQKKMIETLNENNLDVERFNEIQQARQTGNQSITVTPEEQKNIETAGQNIKEIQVNAQKEMETKIQSNGITLARYQEIANQVQNDANLMRKFQEQINK